MLKIFDLSSNFSSLQMGLAELLAFHQVISLGVENPNLPAHFSQLIVEGTMAFNFSQDAPVVQPGDFLPKRMVLRGWPHKQGLEPPW